MQARGGRTDGPGTGRWPARGALVAVALALGMVACQRESAAERAAARYPCELLEMKRHPSPAVARFDSILLAQGERSLSGDTAALKAACDSARAAAPGR